MNGTQPSNRERLAVVVVMSFALAVPADFAREASELAAPNGLTDFDARQEANALFWILQASTILSGNRRSMAVRPARLIRATGFDLGVIARTAKKVASPHPIVGEIGQLFADATGAFHERHVSQSVQTCQASLYKLNKNNPRMSRGVSLTASGGGIERRSAKHGETRPWGAQSRLPGRIA